MKKQSPFSLTVVHLGQVILIGIFFGVLVSITAHIFVEGVKALSATRSLIAPVNVAGIDLYYAHVITLSLCWEADRSRGKKPFASHSSSLMFDDGSSQFNAKTLAKQQCNVATPDLQA